MTTEKEITTKVETTVEVIIPIETGYPYEREEENNGDEQYEDVEGSSNISAFVLGSPVFFGEEALGVGIGLLGIVAVAGAALGGAIAIFKLHHHKYHSEPHQLQSLPLKITSSLSITALPITATLQPI
ncbi:16754_t:CDS:1 [Gigaspora margarita]|uniref:16754_t:CDS:1 n=1 Tax=Gigaspora margarita TaxID=4874 RepID=A0ABM8VYH9_GIGMA|nr:16754_t:CDS:1 [Gigaspora margarita]